MSFTQKTLQAVGFRTKLNPGQARIAQNYGSTIGSVPANFVTYYERLGIVNRGVNMIVDAASQIDVIVGDEKIDQSNLTPKLAAMRQKTVSRLLNTDPNPFMDISSFRRLVFTDLLLNGNAFIYYDGGHLYHVPAKGVEILTDTKEYVQGYRYSTITYATNEMIHIKDNAAENIYRGTPRLLPALLDMQLLTRMLKFQDQFFENGAIPGLVLKSPNALGDKLKEKMIESWVGAYSPSGGGRRPLILDGGLELDKLSNTSFKELDFETSIENKRRAILTALGIPPILLEGGNNANIRPNQRLFYIETVIPLVDKTLRAFERFFSYKLVPDNDIPGLQPELQEQASYVATLVNAGVITVNEAREGLAYDNMSGQDELRIPVNVTGSATDPSQGGRPKEPE
jgi:HK97 family phage portal protein